MSEKRKESFQSFFMAHDALCDSLLTFVSSWSSNLQTSHLPSRLVILALCPSVPGKLCCLKSQFSEAPSFSIHLKLLGGHLVLVQFFIIECYISSIYLNKQLLWVLLSLSSCLRVAPRWGGEHNCRWIKKYTVQKAMSIPCCFFAASWDL